MNNIPGQSAVKTTKQKEREWEVPALKQNLHDILQRFWDLGYRELTIGKIKIDLKKAFGKE